VTVTPNPLFIQELPLRLTHARPVMAEFK
jgi:hypothetical protein